MKIYFKTFGCRVNQTETQSILEDFVSKGHVVAGELEEADICVLNACTVTGEADKDAERFMRSVVKKNPSCRLFVTGCYATRSPDKIRLNAPSAEIIPNSQKKSIVLLAVSSSPLSPSLLTSIPSLSPVTGFEGRTRAFIKVQDGCDMGCAYCVVPSARPVKVSKPLDAVIKEVSLLVGKGFKEIVLCGIRLGAYSCPEKGADLAGLLEKICAVKGDFRIRFSSLEVMETTEGLIEAAKGAGEKFCDYFHIPLQSGSDKVLREMGRVYDTSFYSRKAELLRKAFPNLGLYCDVIAGYPTETEDDFLKTESFINKTGFSGLHVFRYSRRAGTRAEKLGVLDVQTVKARAESLRRADARLRRLFAEGLAGSVQRVLVEESGKFPRGVSSNFQKVRIEGAPGISGFARVSIKSGEKGVCTAVLSGA